MLGTTASRSSGTGYIHKLVPAVEIDVLPRQRRDPFELLNDGLMALPLMIGQQRREQIRVVVDDGIGNETGTVVPHVLLGHRVHAKLAFMGKEGGSAPSGGQPKPRPLGVVFIPFYFSGLTSIFFAYLRTSFLNSPHPPFTR